MKILDDQELETITGGTNKLGGAPPFEILDPGGGYQGPGYSEFGLINAFLSASEKGDLHIPVPNNLKQ